MKQKHILLFFVFLFFPLINFAQASMLPDEQTEERMREFIRDPVIYDCFIKGVVLEKKRRQGLIRQKDYLFQKAELQRIKEERKKTAEGQKAVLASNTIAAGAETTIAVNPNDSTQVVAAFMIGGAIGGCAVYYSDDAGQSWNPSTFVPAAMIMATIPAVSSVDGGGDPTLTVDNNGIFYFAWIGVYVTDTGYYYSTLYATSADGGLSFTAPSVPDFTITAYDQSTSFHFFDRIWMGADAASGSTSGTVYLNGMLYDDTAAQSGQKVFVKPAGSTTFTQSVNESIPVPSGYFCQMANVGVGDNGVVHASGFIYDPYSAVGYGDVVYARSNDQGSTWSTPKVVGTGYIIGGSSFAEENVAVSLGVDSTTIYVAWTDYSSTPKVYYAVSTDDGITWSAPVDVGAAVSPGSYAHLGVNISASDGNCSMAWYRVDNATSQAKYVMAEVRNNGAAPLSYEIISPGDVSFSGGFFGHYNVCRRNGCITHAIWVDGTPGMATAYTAKVDACELGTEVTPIGSELVFNSLYPVPAVNELHVDISVAADAIYTIFVSDVKGQSVAESSIHKCIKGKNSFALNTSKLVPGVYLLRIEKENGVYLIKKFVKG
jgi:hypothetical protein